MPVIDKLLSAFGFERKAANTYSASYYNHAMPSWGSWNENKAFSTVDFIYAVVDMLAQTCSKIPIWGYNLKGEDLPDSDRFAIFLRSMTRKQRYEMFLWYWLRGECFGYKSRILGANARVEKIYWLNPSFVDVIVEDNFPYNITGYWYRNQATGSGFKIDLEEMIHIADFNPCNDILESKRGISKVGILAKRLTKIKSNMDNSVAQMQNGGVPGIVFQKDLPSDSKTAGVVGARRDNFSRYLSNPENKGAPFFAAGEMGYLPLGLSTVEMAAIEAELRDEAAVCNVFHVSTRVFNQNGAGSEISDDNAWESLYLNPVMTATGFFEDEFNISLAPDFGSPDKKCAFDFSDIKVLQADQLKIAQAQAASPTFIPNEQRTAMGLPRIDDPLMDMVYFKTGYTPLDEVGGVDMVGDE